MPKESDGYPPIRDIVSLVNDLASDQFASLETPHGVRVVLPPLPMDVSALAYGRLEELGEQIVTLVKAYEACMTLLDPSPAVDRDPVRPANEPNEHRGATDGGLHCVQP